MRADCVKFIKVAGDRYMLDTLDDHDNRETRVRVRTSSACVIEGDKDDDGKDLAGYIWVFVDTRQGVYGQEQHAALHLTTLQARRLAAALTLMADTIEDEAGVTRKAVKVAAKKKKGAA